MNVREKFEALDAEGKANFFGALAELLEDDARREFLETGELQDASLIDDLYRFARHYTRRASQGDAGCKRSSDFERRIR